MSKWHTQEEIEVALSYYRDGKMFNEIEQLSGIKKNTFKTHITKSDRKIREANGGVVHWRNK